MEGTKKNRTGNVSKGTADKGEWLEKCVLTGVVLRTTNVSWQFVEHEGHEAVQMAMGNSEERVESEMWMEERVEKTACFYEKI